MAQIQISATIGIHIRKDDPTGTNTVLFVGEQTSSTDLYRGLVKVPLTSIPAGSVITAATMDLYLYNINGTNNRQMQVYRCKQVITTGATYNKFDGVTDWQTAGAAGANDREGTASGARTFNTTDSLDAYYPITLDATHLQAMYLGSYVNNGFVLKMDTETDDRYDFRAHGEANPPRLTITYTPPATGAYALFI